MIDPLVRYFERIGARLAVRSNPRLARRYDVTVGRDRRGETFALTVRDNTAGFRVLQANAAARHLLLLAPPVDDRSAASAPTRLLCGHDERHWFVAPIAARVSTITDAKRSLMPEALRAAALPADVVARRRTAGFTRQGEWFFVPTDRTFEEAAVLHGEPLQRGHSKPHMVAELVRFGGERVVLYGGREFSQAEWRALYERDQSVLKGRWQSMVKNPEVYARGAVRHADHATVTLDRWHRVYLNNEALMAGVSFYD